MDAASLKEYHFVFIGVQIYTICLLMTIVKVNYIAKIVITLLLIS